MNIDYHPFVDFDSVYAGGTSPGQWLYDPKTNTIYWKGVDMETKSFTAKDPGPAHRGIPIRHSIAPSSNLLCVGLDAPGIRNFWR